MLCLFNLLFIANCEFEISCAVVTNRGNIPGICREIAKLPRVKLYI